MQVEASVAEADIGQVKIGQNVRFTVDRLSRLSLYVASVQQIRKSATEAQNVVSYLVILDVNNKDGKLLTGMTANVEIVTGRKTDVIRIPSTALRFRPRKADRPDEDDETPSQRDDKKDKSIATVWLEGDDPYEPVEHIINIGLAGEDFVEVTKGLKEKQAVLIRSKNLKPDDDDEDEFADSED